MSHRRSSSPPRSSKPTPEVATPQGGWLERLCFAAFAGLLVAGPLVPSEAAPDIGSGVVLGTLWLTLLAVWLLACWWRGSLQLHSRTVLVAFAGLLAWYAVSTMRVAWDLAPGNARASINGFWQFSSFFAIFFLARHLPDSAMQRRALLALGMSLGVALATHGLYQHFVSMPEMRAEFERNPEAVIEKSGVEAPPGSPQRYLFERRIASTEPFATFALTNSLAAFLAPWLLLLVAVVLRMPVGDLRWLRVLLASVAAICLLSLCIVLTKSRSTYAAASLGLLSLAGVLAWQSERRRWAWILAAVGILAMAVALTIASGVLDWQVISEAPKSLSYRFQYWQASLELIADHPWFGCGPGNFQQCYTHYKLPAASETVADPHNFLLEIGAGAGLPALLLFAAVAAGALWEAWRRRPGGANEPSAGAAEPTAEDDQRIRWLLVGAAGGVIFWYAFAQLGGFVPVLPDFAVLFGALVAGIFLVLIWPWVSAGHLPVGAIGIALGSLLVNLLGAGGISYVGVAQSLWLLIALGLGGLPAAERGANLGRRGILVGLTLALLVAGAAWWTGLRPTNWAQSELDAARRALREGKLELAFAHYQTAAAGDPHWHQPWTEMARVHFAIWANTGDPDDFAGFERTAREAVERHDLSSQLHAEMGNSYLRAYARRPSPERIARAVELLREAARRYPNSNLAHAQLAWALFLAEERPRAAYHAAVALRLDEQNPHGEQKLARQLPFIGPANLDLPPSLEESRNPEQLMRYLRNE